MEGNCKINEFIGYVCPNCGEVYENCYELSKTLIDLYHNISFKTILGHRETYPLLNKPIEKTCPGTLFDMNKLRARVENGNY